MNPLIRYWLFPGRLRRLHPAGKVAVALGCVLATAGLTLLILRLNVSLFNNFGPVMILAIVLFAGLPSILSIFGTFAGATLIAGERQKETWETLLLSPMPVRQIVLLKLAARVVFCLIIATPATIFFAATLYKIIHSGGFNTHGIDTPDRVKRLRTALVVIWMPLQTLAHLLPFVTLGLAVSAACRKVTHALMVSSAILMAYGVLFWQLFTTFHVYGVVNSSNPGLWFVLFRWPVLPFLSGDYRATQSVPPEGWQNNLAADLIWSLLVPALLLPLAIHWSRLSRTGKSPHRLNGRTRAADLAG